jgi:hypothetical protein
MHNRVQEYNDPPRTSEATMDTYGTQVTEPATGPTIKEEIYPEADQEDEQVKEESTTSSDIVMQDIQTRGSTTHTSNQEQDRKRDLNDIKALKERMEKIEEQIRHNNRKGNGEEEMRRQLKSLSGQIDDLFADNLNLRKNATRLRNWNQWLHDGELEYQREDSGHRMVVSSWPSSEVCSEKDRIRVELWVMEQFKKKHTPQNDIIWEHTQYDGNEWKLNKITHIKFHNEADKTTFARWVYKTYSGKNPLTYWDEKYKAIQHRGTHAPHRLIIAPYLSKMERIQGLPLQVCSHLLTKGSYTGGLTAPYKNSKALSFRAEAKQLIDRDQNKVVCEVTYNSDNGRMKIWVSEEIRTYTEMHLVPNWTRTLDRHPSYRLFRDYPYELEFATITPDRKEKPIMNYHGDEEYGETQRNRDLPGTKKDTYLAQEKRKRSKSQGGNEWREKGQREEEEERKANLEREWSANYEDERYEEGWHEHEKEDDHQERGTGSGEPAGNRYEDGRGHQGGFQDREEDGRQEKWRDDFVKFEQQFPKDDGYRPALKRSKPAGSNKDHQ